jgi:hypothetical protein
MKPKKKTKAAPKPAPKPAPMAHYPEGIGVYKPRFVVRLTDDEYESLRERARAVRAFSLHAYVRDVLLGFRPEGCR